MNDTSRRNKKDLQRLLACIPVITGPCELDLLVFFYRHPRSILTNEQLAALVGYDTKQIAHAIEAFIGAGLLERTQTSMHAARMYVLAPEGPQLGGFKTLLDLASTRQGRHDTLELLTPGRAGPPSEINAKRRLRVVA